MIQAVIFDMDGLLIDSEPLWRQAEVQVFNQIGVPLTEDMSRQTTGLRTDEVVEHWYAQYPWVTPSKVEVEANITKTLIALIQEQGQPMAGVSEILALLAQKQLPLAIASSSSTEIIEAVMKKLDIRDHFQVIQSAEHERYGKPHPGVYIEAALKLGVAPSNCLALEDSPNGVLAAKAARMKCIAVPDPEVKDDTRFCIADEVISSLTEFNQEVLDL